jgi:hypothetical protein
VGGVTGLVEEALAANGSAETGNAVCGVHFALKFVVVGEFLVYVELVSRTRALEGCYAYLAQYPAMRR